MATRLPKPWEPTTISRLPPAPRSIRLRLALHRCPYSRTVVARASSVKCQHRAASGCAPTLRLTNRDVLGSDGGPTPYPSPTTSAFPFSLYFFVWRKKNHLSCSISAVPDTGRMQRQERAPLVRPRGFDPNQVIDATPQQKMRKLLMFVTVRAAVDYDALRCE